METRKRRATRVAQTPVRHKKDKKSKKKKHKGLKIFGWIVLVLVLIGGAIGGKAYLDVKKASDKAYQEVNRKTVAKLPSLKAKSPFSFLFLGVNGKTANDVLVLTVNPKQNKTTVISLKRDIYLTSEKTTLKNLYGTKGVAGEIDALQTLLGVSIPRYVQFDMRGLGDFVEAVGGVEVANDTEFISNGYQFKKGTLSLHKSDEVKAFLTKVTGGDVDDEKADAALIEREQAVLMAVIPKMKSVKTVLKYNQFVSAFGDNVKTDLVFGNLKALALNYNGVLGNITKENLKTTKTTIDGKDQIILSEDQVNKAHDRIEEALSE
ncbi:LCP family protein [Lactococcus insecticola]|uniref:Transcriptional regulator n=1 Tax=Pseudolactococcus insecticola TaxID=2709158 RepID=A0A6A0B718_9LACT|nr:LCP family protein [Lactococcus insecticola]GFH40291.1 transcriptional regulator [Lactococcus insecticola]